MTSLLPAGLPPCLYDRAATQKPEVRNLYFLRGLISVSEMCNPCFEIEIHECILSSLRITLPVLRLTITMYPCFETARILHLLAIGGGSA
jgi:hypothetical protein